MKAIVLARVSDKKQDSNEAQISRLAEYIKYKQLDVWKTVEIEESSTKGDRAKFQEVVKEVEKSKEPMAIVVDTVDRLQRSFRESVQLDDMRKKGKIEIHFYRENLVINENSNSSDLLRWDMAVMFARSYVLQLSDNVKRKIDQMLREGRWPGKAVFGYTNYENEDKKNDIKKDDFNAKIVKMIYEMYASGSYSFESIRAKLLADYKLKFSNGNLSKILGNTFYYGVMLWKGKYYPHRYERIIDKNLYDKVQIVRAGFNKKRRKIVALPAIYRGLITCSTCGCAVSPESHKGKFYYQCTESKGKHGASMLSEAKINEQVSQLFSMLTLPQDVADEVLTTLRNLHQGKVDFREELSRKLNQEKEDLAVRKERLLETYLEKRITGSEYDKYKANYDTRTIDIEVQLDGLGRAEDNYYSTVEQVIKLTARAKEIFDCSEAEHRRRLVGLTLSNLRLDGKIVLSDWKKPFNLIAKYNDHSLGLPLIDMFRNREIEFGVNLTQVKTLCSSPYEKPTTQSSVMSASYL